MKKLFLIFTLFLTLNAMSAEIPDSLVKLIEVNATVNNHLTVNPGLVRRNDKLAGLQLDAVRSLNQQAFYPLHQPAPRGSVVPPEFSLTAQRVPPQMMGIMPSNVGGFGDVEKASKVFVRNELIPLQKRLEELNKWIGEPIINFSDYAL